MHRSKTFGLPKDPLLQSFVLHFGGLREEMPGYGGYFPTADEWGLFEETVEPEFLDDCQKWSA
jgi:hypothetical protein